MIFYGSGLKLIMCCGLTLNSGSSFYTLGNTDYKYVMSVLCLTILYDPKLIGHPQLSKNQATSWNSGSCSSWKVIAKSHGKIWWPCGFVFKNPYNICPGATQNCGSSLSLIDLRINTISSEFKFQIIIRRKILSHLTGCPVNQKL